MDTRHSPRRAEKNARPRAGALATAILRGAQTPTTTKTSRQGGTRSMRSSSRRARPRSSTRRRAAATPSARSSRSSRARASTSPQLLAFLAAAGVLARGGAGVVPARRGAGAERGGRHRRRGARRRDARARVPALPECSRAPARHESSPLYRRVVDVRAGTYVSAPSTRPCSAGRRRRCRIWRWTSSTARPPRGARRRCAPRDRSSRSSPSSRPRLARAPEDEARRRRDDRPAHARPRAGAPRGRAARRRAPCPLFLSGAAARARAQEDDS